MCGLFGWCGLGVVGCVGVMGSIVVRLLWFGVVGSGCV